MGDFWVFGYGSLVWNPGFPYISSRPAKLFGLHRALCIHSWVHRGTRQNPGLVLGLDKGGSCSGVAFKVAEHERDTVIEYLRARELVTDVYLETWRKIHLNEGNSQLALTYMADTSSPQYSGHLPLETQVEIVKSAIGKSGENIHYIQSTVEHLRALSIHDRQLELIVDQLGKLKNVL